MEIVTLRDAGNGVHETDTGQRYRYCSNHDDYDVCNWLRAITSDNSLCRACRFNRTVPNLSRSRNLARWRRFEIAKKRLLYTLMRLELPLSNGFEEPRGGLVFDFVEDKRSDPARYPESFIQTGFHGGVITINTLEADDAMRETVKAELNEVYRTLLGHLRHESGHYYWASLDADTTLRERFAVLYGDNAQDYAQALADYYAAGPRADWRDRYITAYASTHPAEDWAESWGHYLHIYDALETAAAYGVIDEDPATQDIAGRVDRWRTLSVVLNELNRSSGLGDPYPFVVNSVVADKLGFVDEVIGRLRERSRARADR